MCLACIILLFSLYTGVYLSHTNPMNIQQDTGHDIKGVIILYIYIYISSVALAV